ncbi:MAG: exo-alpha-sialidase [Lentisphaeria bacterium]|nr:exo-alpha-sialidase [Lentisphaeria bacterium]
MKRVTDAALPREPSAPGTGHRGDVTDVRVVRHVRQHPEAWQLWQPHIVRATGLLSNGRRPEHLVCAYGAMINGKKDMGSIWVSISKDDGDSWEEPTPLFDHTQRHGAIQFGYANPVLFAPPGQDVIWCFAQRCPIVRQNSPDAELVGAFSADAGRSWTPVEMAMVGYHGPLIVCSEPYPSEIAGRKVYLLPAHRNAMQKDALLGTRDHFILSSTSLLEWKLEAYIPQPQEGRVFLHEGCIAPGDASGEIKIVMRTANYDDDSRTTDPPRAYSSVSRDGGHTWSPAQPEPDLYNAKAKAWFGRATDGTHVYVYNDGPPQREGGRNALRYRTKPPGGVWSEEKTFYDAGVKNSYPTLLEYAPGEFHAVWDSGTAAAHRTHIRFGKVRIP